MAGSGSPTGMGGRIKGSVVAAARYLERSMRSFIKHLSPSLALHNLRWHLNSREYLRQ
jgi:hypothetical protein